MNRLMNRCDIVSLAAKTSLTVGFVDAPDSTFTLTVDAISSNPNGMQIVE